MAREFKEIIVKGSPFSFAAFCKGVATRFEGDDESYNVYSFGRRSTSKFGLNAHEIRAELEARSDDSLVDITIEKVAEEREAIEIQAIQLADNKTQVLIPARGGGFACEDYMDLLLADLKRLDQLIQTKPEISSLSRGDLAAKAHFENKRRDAQIRASQDLANEMRKARSSALEKTHSTKNVKRTKRGPKSRPDKEKIEALKAWENLDRSVPLEEFLEQRFGTTQGGDLIVKPSTFHGWRTDLRKRNLIP